MTTEQPTIIPNCNPNLYAADVVKDEESNTWIVTMSPIVAWRIDRRGYAEALNTAGISDGDLTMYDVLLNSWTTAGGNTGHGKGELIKHVLESEGLLTDRAA